MHISEISNSFVRNVFDYASLNETLFVRILSVDEKGHYKLSLKQVKDSNGKISTKIEETSHGFETLHQNLDNWVNEAIVEIEKK